MMITNCVRLDQKYFVDFGTNRNNQRTIEQLCVLFSKMNKYKEDDPFNQRLEVQVRYLETISCIQEAAK